METAKKSKKKKIITEVLIALVTLLLAVFVVRLISAKIKGEPYFLFNRYSLIWVLTNSMEEEIPERSYILIEKIKGEDAKVGDVITFVSSDPTLQGSLNTHRVADIVTEDGSTKIITKGDHNIVEDSYAALPENVVGRYVTTLPLLTIIGRIFMTNAGLLLIFVGMLLMIGFSIYNSVISLKQTKKRELLDQQMAERVGDLLKASLESGHMMSVEEAQAKVEKQMEMERLIAEEVEKLKASGMQNAK